MKGKPMPPPDLTITLTHDEVCFLLTTFAVVGMPEAELPEAECRQRPSPQYQPQHRPLSKQLRR
jgi:hypothetical protein